MSANLPWSSSDSHSASPFSSILRTKENSVPTGNSNSYSESINRGTRLSGSLSKGNDKETFQASIYDFLPLGNDAPCNPSTGQPSASFVYVEDTVENSPLAEDPKSNVSSVAMQDTSAVSTLSRFLPNSRITQSKMENSISAPVSMTTHQYKSDSTVMPYFQTDANTIQNPVPFFQSTRRSKPFFATNPVAYTQNAKNEFSSSADGSTTVMSSANNLPMKEAGPDNIYFIDTSNPIKEGNTAKIYATDIPGDYTTLFDVPDMEDKDIIITDASNLKRYGKTVSNALEIPQKDNSIIIDATDLKNNGRTTVNVQTPSILSANNGNDFESVPILSNYKADTKSVMIGTDSDEAISNINPVNTKNYFLNYRMYEKSNNVNNSNDTKTMLDKTKNTMHVGDLIISKTNGITSTKHYANPNPTEPMTNTNMNIRKTWPLMEGMIIEGRQPVQMENTITPYNNNIAKTMGSKVDDSIIKYHSNIPAKVHLKTDRNNFKSANTDEIKDKIPVVQEIINIDQDDEVVEEIIFIPPGISTTEIRRKGYYHNPDADYAQTAGSKIIIPSDVTNMFNPLFRYKIEPFTMDGKNLINNRGDHRTSTTITANDAKANMDIERSTVFKTVNSKNNITPAVFITHPGNSGFVYFSKDSVADMTSTSKVSTTLSDKSTDSVDEVINLSNNYNHADGVTGPNPETDFPMYKGYTLLSVAESSTSMPNVQNNQAQNSLLIKDNPLTGAWIADPVNENPHLINNAIIQKWKINKVSADPMNIPLESTFLTADFSSPNDEYSATASAGKRTTNMTDSSELMINKATMPKGRPTVAMTFLPAKKSGILTPRKRFGSFIDNEIANEEESTPYVEAKSVVEGDAVFQKKEDLPPTHNFKYFESGESGFERNGFLSVDTSKSLSQLSSNTPATEITISDRYFPTLGEENHILHDVTKPEDDTIHFQTLSTKTIAHGLGKTPAVKQNAEAAGGTEFLPPSNPISQTERTDNPIFHHLYYNIITDNPLTNTQENLNTVQNIMKHKLSLSTMDNADIIDYRDGYQTPVASASSNAKRLVNKGKMAGTETTNIPLGMTTISDDISYVNKNTEVITDLTSIAATSPIKKGFPNMNKVNILNHKPNKLGDDLNIPRKDPKVTRDNGTLLVADSSTSMKSAAPFNHFQATNPIKKTSLADIIIPKPFLRSTPASLMITTDALGGVDTMFYTPRYESENAFKEDITLNNEADPPKGIGIMAEGEDTLKEENVGDHVYVIPIADNNIPKGKNLEDKHHSLNSDVYSSTRFKGTTKTTADQPEFETPASTYITEVSKPLHGNFTSEFQGKVIVTNSNSGAENDDFFGGDILYPMMGEDAPKGYAFSPERISTFITPNFRIPMKNNINPALGGIILLDKGTSRKNFVSYTDKQTDPETEKDQIIPVTLSTPVSSENVNVGNYYHMSRMGTPLSLGYANKLRDNSFILQSGNTLPKKNNLDAMDLIVTEPDKNNPEYISNKRAFELEKEENSPVKIYTQFISGPNEFVSQTPSSTGETSKSLLYRKINPEFESEDKYQTIILKEENTNSDIVATSLKDYTKNFNTQHLKIMMPSHTDARETFSPEFLKGSSVEKGTLREDDDVIILPKVSGLGNKKIKYFFSPHTEITSAMGENRTFGTDPIDHAVITTPIKSQDNFYRKGISSNVSNTAAPELADTLTSENSKVNENKMNLAEVRPSEDHINPLAQDIASQAEKISSEGEATKSMIKTTSIASLNPVNAGEMLTNATTISHYVSTFDSKDSNGKGDPTMPEVDGVLPVELNFLFIPNQKKPRTAVALSENDDSLSNKFVTVKASEPLAEYSAIMDQDWKPTKVQSDPHPLSVLSALSKSNNNKEEEIIFSEVDNFVLGDSRTLKDNPFIGKFNISARPQAPPSLKRILSANSTMSLEKPLKLKDKNSALPNEDAGTAGLLPTATIGSYELQWKSTLSPFDFTASMSSSKHSELDPVVKMKKNTTAKTNNNTPFEERNSTPHKNIISPNTNTPTKDMLNTIFNKRFLQRNFVEKDIKTENEAVLITENISDTTLDGENIPNNEDIISIVLDDTALEYATNEYVLEPQEKKNNSIIKKTALIYDPQAVQSHLVYSSADAYKHLFQGSPMETKTKKMLQNLIPREEHISSNIDAILKSSTENLNSKAPRSMTYPSIHTSENFQKFLGKTSLKRDTLRDDDTIITFPEDKRMEYNLVPDPEITVTMGEGRMFPDESIDPMVITSPLKNKIKFYGKVSPSAAYNIDGQRKAENILSSRVDNVKDKTNTAETPYSQHNNIPLAEFRVIPDGKLSFINEDTKTLNNRVSISSSPMNTDHTVDDLSTLSTESNYDRGVSMAPEDNIRSRGFLTLQTPEKTKYIPNASAENLKVSDPVTYNALANSSVAWSNMVETMIEYPNSTKDGDDPIKNNTDLKPYSLTSTKLLTGSTSFSDNPTNNEFDSLVLVNRGTSGISTTKTDEKYSEPHRKTKVIFPTKVSQYRVYEEEKIANFSHQEDPADNFNLRHITNPTVLSPAWKKILPSVTESNTLSKSDNNVEVTISYADNFFPKDANTLKENSFTVEFDGISTKSQVSSNLKGISSGGSTLTLPEASRPNDQSSSPEVAIGEGTIVNTPTGTYHLPSWKPSPLPSDFTTLMSSSKYYKFGPVVKMKRGITTKTRNNILPEESNAPSVKVNISPNSIISTKPMKNTIANKFGEKTLTENEASMEVFPFIENISEEEHDTLLASQNIPNNKDLVTTLVDNALENAADNYIFELIKEGNGSLTGKSTHTNDFNGSESHAPYASAAVSEHLSQESPVDIKTNKKHQNMVPKEKIPNSDNNPTILKSSTVTFDTKTPRSMIYSLTDSRWSASPGFLDETIIEKNSPVEDNTIINLPKGKMMEYPFVPDPELMTRMRESRIFTTDSTDPPVIINPVAYKDQFNRKGASSVLYNNAAPGGAKSTIPARFKVNKHKSNLEYVPPSLNFIPLAELSVTPDNDLPFINRNSEEENNRASLFSSPMNKAASTVVDPIVLSTEGSYERSDSMLPGEDNAKSKGFSSLLTSAMFIPNSLTENPDKTGLMTDNSLSESLVPRLEMLERATEFSDIINEGDAPEEVIITQADIHSYPLASNVPLAQSPTFSDIPAYGEIDSFFSLNRDTPNNYNSKAGEIYSKSQRTMMKVFPLREGSQNSVHKRRKTASLFDQEDPAAQSELSHFVNAAVLSPSMGKTLPPGTEPNPLFKTDNSKDAPFGVNFDATSFKPQTPSNFKEIFLADSTLTLPKTSRPASPDKVINTRGPIANTLTELDGLHHRLTFLPSDLTTFPGTSEYSKLVPVTITGEDTIKKVDYNIPPDEIIIPFKKVIFPNTITSEKDTANTLKGNIFENEDFRERETAAEYEIIYLTEDTSERMDDISSTGKITPAYMDYLTIIPGDSGSEYVSDKQNFELEDRANNSPIKTSIFIHVPKTHGTHVPYTTVASLNSLSKATSPELKAKENYQTIIAKQENNNFDTGAIAHRESNANVNPNRPTTGFLIDASKNFPSSFSDKISLQKAA